MLLNNQVITEEIKDEINKQKIETNDNKTTVTQKPMRCSKNSSKKEVSKQSHLKKQEKSLINNLILYLKQLEKEEKNPVSRRKEITKIRAEVNEIETKETQISETKSWLFEKINELDKTLPRLIKKKGEDLHQ